MIVSNIVQTLTKILQKYNAAKKMNWDSSALNRAGGTLGQY